MCALASVLSAEGSIVSAPRSRSTATRFAASEYQPSWSHIWAAAPTPSPPTRASSSGARWRSRSAVSALRSTGAAAAAPSVVTFARPSKSRSCTRAWSGGGTALALLAISATLVPRARWLAITAEPRAAR
jgi:hypothetical protein